MMTLGSMLERALRLYGANSAIIDNEACFSWAEHMERVQRLASVLSSLGLGKGDRYGIICRNTWRHCELLHAGYWAGIVPVPVNYRLAPREVRFILEDSGVEHLFVEDVFKDVLDSEDLAPWRESAIPVRSPDSPLPSRQLEDLMGAATATPVVESEEDDDAILLYTGGTTGRSKGVRLSHRNVYSNGQQCAIALKMRMEDVYLHVAPMFHSADLLGTGYTLVGAAHVYLPAFTPTGLLQTIQDCGVTSAMMAPTMIIMTLQEPALGEFDLASFNRIFYGSSPMAVEWTRRTMDAFAGAHVQQGYGLTETSPILTTLDEEVHVEAMETGRYEILKSVGRPVTGIDLRIVGPDNRELPSREIGEVVVRGPNVTKGYLNRPRETAEAFDGEWFHTGDVGQVDENGFLYLLDRKKDVIITGGENVYSSEVEAVLYQCEDVLECAVVGVPDERYGEALFAAIVPRPGASLDQDRMIEHCRGRIGGYKIPRKMAFLEELPKSAMGKILKTELRKTYGDGAV